MPASSNSAGQSDLGPSAGFNVTPNQPRSLTTGLLWLALTTVFALALDLWTKHLSVQLFPPSTPAYDFIPGYLQFTAVENHGAVFGFAQGWRWLFVVVSLAAIGFVGYMFARSPRRWWNDVLLGMLLAGILGNLYDRIFIGHVRDMIHALPDFHWGGTWQIPLLGYPPPDRSYFPWVFNVADSLLCVSIAMLLIAGFFVPDAQRTRADDHGATAQ